MKYAINIALCSFLLVGLWNASWIHIKAQLAQLLIEHAWQQRLTTHAHNVKPWAWADTEPVAKLTLPNGEVAIVLRGAQGNSLAFGPGLVEGSALPGTGFSVIGGHRDTHFASLKYVSLDQTLEIQQHTGASQRYKITDVRIVDIDITPLEVTQENTLVLITCYPFEGIQSDVKKRWVVTAKPVPFF